MEKDQLIQAVVAETHLPRHVVERVIVSTLAFLRKSTGIHPAEATPPTKPTNPPEEATK